MGKAVHVATANSHSRVVLLLGCCVEHTFQGGCEGQWARLRHLSTHSATGVSPRLQEGCGTSYWLDARVWPCAERCWLLSGAGVTTLRGGTTHVGEQTCDKARPVPTLRRRLLWLNQPAWDASEHEEHYVPRPKVAL
jgi:hypothetical protein